MVYLLLADGFEEMEALAPADLLRRAGVDLRLVGISGRSVTSARGITVQVDIEPGEVCMDSLEMVILPGGGQGTQNLYASEYVRKLVRYCVDHNRWVAAICATPSVILGGMRLLQGKKVTCFPGMEDGMVGALPQDCAVCIDGNLITGRAAGTSIEFALALCAVLKGQAAADEVRHKIVYDCR